MWCGTHAFSTPGLHLQPPFGFWVSVIPDSCSVFLSRRKMHLPSAVIHFPFTWHLFLRKRETSCGLLPCLFCILLKEMKSLLLSFWLWYLNHSSDTCQISSLQYISSVLTCLFGLNYSLNKWSDFIYLKCKIQTSSKMQKVSFTRIILAQVFTYKLNQFYYFAHQLLPGLACAFLNGWGN